MNSEDNIFDIFDGVLSNENDFSSFFTNSPLPEHSEPMHEDIAPMLSIPQTTTEPQQAVTEPQPSIVLQPSETAQCMWAVQNVRHDVNAVVPAFVLIKVRSRDEDEIWNSVPESMYSSIRYTMTISIDPSALPVALTPLLMAQVRVVDEHGVEIKKENGESVIKGPKEFQNLDLNKENGRLECDITIKWQSVSFHHAKRKFAFLVSFFDFADGHMQLLFEARSASFLTYARRPKVGDRVKKALAPVNTAVCKKRKTTPKKKEEEKSVQFQNFTEILDKLVGLQESLPEQERPLASQLIREKLLKEGLSIVDQL